MKRAVLQQANQNTTHKKERTIDSNSTTKTQRRQQLKSPVTKAYKQIISPFEIAGLFIVFLAVLALLFPKSNLEKAVFTDKSNVDLTIIYLQNLVKLEPKNSHLLLAMAASLHEQQKEDKAIKLLQELEDNPNSNLQSKATLLHLQINQEKLNKKHTKQEEIRIQKENFALLSHISKQEITDAKSNETLYNTALSLHDKKSALRFNLGILNSANLDDRIHWLKNAHYLAESLDEGQTDIMILKALIKKDREKKSLWLSALLSKLPKDYDLKTLAQELSLGEKHVASLYLAQQKPQEAVDIYLHLLQKSDEKKEQSSLLKKIIKILQANGQVVKAAQIAQHYENNFLEEIAMRKYLLKLYLAAGKTKWARALSLKIIQEKEPK